MKVFVSSVFLGLQQARDKLIRNLQTAGDIPVAMEVFGPRPETPLDTCLAELRRSDLILLMIGPRYGSIEPGSGVSYTHRELLEAIKVGVPVYAFDVGTAADLTETEREGLERFRRDAGTALTWKKTSEQELAADAIAAVLRHVRTHGEAGTVYRVFQPPSLYFKPLLNAATPFNLTHAFVDREQELADLVGHAEAGIGVRVLIAEGGAGKSRLLREVGEKADREKASVRYVAPDAPWTVESLRELPHGPVCVVIDDAHHRDDLESLTSACLQANPACRFIVAARPGAVEQVHSALRALPGGAGERPDLRLSRLTEAGAIALAHAVLGPKFSHLAKALTRRSAGNPLVISVGGRAVARGEIHPELLEQSDESFRRSALDRLVEDVDAPSRRALDVLAAVSPLRLDDMDAVVAVAKFLNVAVSELRTRLAALERQSLLLRRGQGIRVSPDVLADHLLSVVAVTPDGRPTGFVDEVLAAVGITHLPNLLANVSELEWRTEALREHVRVSDELWRRLRSELAARSYRRRGELVTVLKRAAAFSPSHALDLAVWLAGQPSPGPDETEQRYGLADDPKPQWAALTDLITFVGQHPDYTVQCIRWLAERAVADPRGAQSDPEHPVRMLQNLAEYRDGQPFEVQHATIVELGRFAGRPDRPRPSAWIASVFAKAVEREGEYQRAGLRSVTLGAFPLYRYMKQITPMRTAALDALGQLAAGPDATEAVPALDALTRGLHLPEGRFGREVGPEERSAWLPEARGIIERIRHVYETTPHDAVRLRLRRTLSEWPEGAWEEIEPELRRMADELPELPQQALYDVLQGEQWGVVDYQVEEQRFMRAAREAAEALWQRHPADARAVIGEVWSAAQVLESVLGEHAARGAHALVRALADVNTDLATDLALAVIDMRAEALAEAAPAVLHRRRADPDRGAERVLFAAAAACPSQRIRFRFASVFRSLYNGRMVGPDDLEPVLLFRNDPDPWTRVHALNALRYAPESLVPRAVEIFLSFDLGDAPNCVDEAVGVFDDGRFGMRIEWLADGHIDAILEHIAQVRSISRGTHGIVTFLRAAGARRPRRVVDLFLRRIERAAEREEGVDQFRPIPFASEGVDLRSVGTSPEGPQLVREVALACARDDHAHTSWRPQLIAMIATPEVAVHAAEELARAGRPTGLLAAAAALRRLPHELVFDRDDVVALIVCGAAEADGETRQRVHAALFDLATSGTYSGTPGKPAPRLVAMRDRAAALAAKHRDNQPVREFYDGLRDFASRAISRDAAQWEQEEADWEDAP